MSRWLTESGVGRVLMWGTRNEGNILEQCCFFIYSDDIFLDATLATDLPEVLVRISS